jgi:hypothetical protein
VKLFNDRRPAEHLPTEEDYERPLDRSALAEANKRFRHSGVPSVIHSDPDAAHQRIREVTKLRRKGQQFNSVGEYLEFLNGTNT